ncbi:LysR family transcriptional regulator [Variovorax rhizosphaerae]|uniref:LysR family transcriptional regulator n=1 Tax=Variovorax rhizosphaerae TaxID=1836200 RepID=A0ABU8WEF7_9BURK
MKLDPVSLKLFVAVVEEQGIGKAAEREHIAGAAISKRITELEGILRTQLLTRSYKGVEPTAAGIALLRLARQALHSLDEIHTQMLDYAGGTRGQVRLFANISAITQFLPADLATFAEEYPQIQLNLEERNSAVTTKAVAENAADVGIYTRQPHGDNVETLPYEEDELAVVLRRDHPLAARKSLQLTDLLDWDFVGLRTGSAINSQLTEAAVRTGRTVRLRVQVTGYDALCLMVSAGLGIAIAPHNIARLFVKRLNICEVKLDEPWARRELCICVPNGPRPVASSLLVQHLQKCASERKP